MNLYYLEILFICIIILIILIFKVITNSNRIICYRPYMRTLMYTLLLGFSNIATYVTDGVNLGLFNFLHYLFHAISLITICSIYFSWMLYSETINDSKLVSTKLRKNILAIPFFSLIVWVYISFFTNGIFYIDADYNYIHGRYYFIFVIITYLYLLLTSIFSIKRYLDPNKLIYKNKNEIIFIFSLISTCFIFISIAIFKRPQTIAGFTIGFIYSYLSFLDQLITIDPLTQLNNRGQFVNILTNEIKNYNNESEPNDLYLLMMDLDYFKSINDKYGHVEGDNAIITVANILRRCCSYNGYFLSRYGGDEFNIIIKTKDKNEVTKLCKEIERCFDEYNIKSNKPYKLLISIGMKKYTSKIKNVNDFINKADKDLYKVKQERKQESI